MTVQRSRTRGEASAPEQQSQPAGGRLGAARGFLTGAAARARSEQVVSEQNQVSQRRASGLDADTINRYRFRLKQPGQDFPGGEEAFIIILDRNLDEVLFADEHSFKDSEGRWGLHAFCPKEYDTCPLCDMKEIGPSSYTMFLTVLDLRGIPANDRREAVPHFKRLMPVRANLHAEFFKLHDAAMKEFGTMRGMNMLMLRDGSVNSAIGVPAMMPNGRMFDIISEEELVAEFGAPEQRDPERDNIVIRPENYDITPFAYTRIFHPESGEELRRKYGGGAPAGSRDDIHADFRGRETAANQGRVMRSRSPLSDGGAAGHGFNRQPSPQDGPVQPGVARTIPGRTISRPSADGPLQPAANSAPAPRPRSRTPVATPATPEAVTPRPRSRVQRSSGTPGGPTGAVANDLDDADIPFAP